MSNAISKRDWSTMGKNMILKELPLLTTIKQFYSAYFGHFRLSPWLHLPHRRKLNLLSHLRCCLPKTTIRGKYCVFIKKELRSG